MDFPVNCKIIAKLFEIAGSGILTGRFLPAPVAWSMLGTSRTCAIAPRPTCSIAVDAEAPQFRFA